MCWHVSLECLGAFAHTNSFYLWTYSECSEEKSGKPERDGNEIPLSQEEVGGDWLLLREKCQTLPSTLDPCLKEAKALSH